MPWHQDTKNSCWYVHARKPHPLTAYCVVPCCSKLLITIFHHWQADQVRAGLFTLSVHLTDLWHTSAAANLIQAQPVPLNENTSLVLGTHIRL